MATIEVPDELLDDMLDVLEQLEEQLDDVPQPVLTMQPEVAYWQVPRVTLARRMVAWLGVPAGVAVAVFGFGADPQLSVLAGTVGVPAVLFGVDGYVLQWKESW